MIYWLNVSQYVWRNKKKKSLRKSPSKCGALIRTQANIFDGALLWKSLTDVCKKNSS